MPARRLLMRKIREGTTAQTRAGDCPTRRWPGPAASAWGRSTAICGGRRNAGSAGRCRPTWTTRCSKPGCSPAPPRCGTVGRAGHGQCGQHEPLQRLDPGRRLFLARMDDKQVDRLGAGARQRHRLVAQGHVGVAGRTAVLAGLFAGLHPRAQPPHLDLGIFDRTLYQQLFRDISRFGWRKPPYEEPFAMESEEPRRFERLCHRALAEEAISEAKAAELLGLSVLGLRRRMAEPDRERPGANPLDGIGRRARCQRSRKIDHVEATVDSSPSGPVGDDSVSSSSSSIVDT